MYVLFCIHIFIIYSNMQKMIILQVYTRFVSDNHMEEELLLCKPLTATTKAGGIMAMMHSFFEEEKLFWAQMVGYARMEHPPCSAQSQVCILL